MVVSLEGGWSDIYRYPHHTHDIYQQMHRWASWRLRVRDTYLPMHIVKFAFLVRDDLSASVDAREQTHTRTNVRTHPRTHPRTHAVSQF